MEITASTFLIELHLCLIAFEIDRMSRMLHGCADSKRVCYAATAPDKHKMCISVDMVLHATHTQSQHALTNTTVDMYG